MAEKEPFGYQKPALTPEELAQRLDRVDELVSMMLDEELDERQVGELEGLLLESSEARSQYIGMVQLHSDLMEYYNPQSIVGANSPILAHLTDSIDVTPPAPQQPKD